MQAVDNRSPQDFLLQIVLYQVPWFGLWAGANVFFYKSKILNQDSRNHLVALVYSIGTIVFAVRDLWMAGRQLHQANSQQENTFVSLSLSFVLHEFIVNCVCGQVDFRSMVSCLLSSVGLFSVLHHGIGAPLLLMGSLVVETTAVLMHVRKMLGNRRKRHTAAYELCLLAYIAAFFIIRCVFGTIFVFYVAIHKDWAPKAFLATSLLALAESLSHLKGVFELFKQCVAHRDERVEKGVSLWWWSVNPGLRELEYYQRMKANNKRHHEKTD